ncbi:transcriptional regulator, AraC family [Leadbetterella byssophila DSM 17132]|uniref:Transcriptional regulator, AraC family n=1 Tax=Leadbetterella byssophila (strain DSM 17132 / JCM 16389 / KACC 11308 / NBRC 106382 / 4M15) TaxID=649349 RepID=E4RU24_LEAB4|nr:helix-turn-helix transcriptional regulator [Leadbetterella byssophila]ADQ16005.1 transcriptional regulator, AraC family [Leadbetterella byssophila DSM 17132]MDV4070549.1 AraC family transcriptional regulator [Elizabethkingia anophelis]
MERVTQAQQFFDDKLIWMPDHLQREIGQFNVFPIYSTPTNKINCQPYNRKGFYKISLLKGRTKFSYADKGLEFKDSALLFSNPNIPYSWELLDEEQTGYFCVFTEGFFNHFGNINDYPVFKPGNIPLFELNEEQEEQIGIIFKKMIAEIESDYFYKYDAIRALVFELIHLALKLTPIKSNPVDDSNASLRITSLFTELLERQFPIESPRQQIKLRHPIEFADNLSVHVNHLNRSLKKVTGKTTSQFISERIMQEARSLLQHTDWNISEISWCLGFEELPHFINFFKKAETSTPKHYRNSHL